MRVKFHGHSTVELQINDGIIYIDPYLNPFSAEHLPKADLILVSNASFDHCSIETVRALSGDNTVVLGSSEVATLLQGCGSLRAGELRDFDDFQLKVLAVTQYNAQKISGSLFAFVIHAEDKILLYSSDCKYSREFADIHPDIMLVGVGGSLTMSAKEAAIFVTNLIPKLAVPIHFGRLNGTIDDAVYFKELVEEKQETKVVILDEDEEIEL